MPVDDNQVSRTVTWSELAGELPRGGCAAQANLDPAQMPDVLETALRALYDADQRRFLAWEATDEGTPPVFIVVCSNTSVSKWMFDWIGGHQRDDQATPGRLPLFSNVDDDGRWLHRPARSSTAWTATPGSAPWPRRWKRCPGWRRT